MPTKQPSFLARTTLGLPNYLLVAMATIFMLAMAPLAAQRAIVRQSNQIAEWLPAADGVSIDQHWFAEQFKGEQFFLVSWSDCTLGKPAKLAALTRQLQQENVAAIQRIETGPQWIERLMAEPYGLAYEGAVSRLEGTFVGPTQRDERGASLGQPSRMTCMALYLTLEAAANDAVVAATINQVRLAARDAGIPPETLRMAGPAIDSARTNQEALASLLRWGGLAVLLSMAILAWRLRSLRLAALVTLPAVASGATALALVFYAGVLEVVGLARSTPLLGVADALVTSTPLLVYGLTLVAALRYLYYYRDARLAHGVAGAAEQAVADGWPSWGLVALLFAAVMGTLCFSELLPLRRFGLFAGLGMLASVGAVLSILPVWIHRYPLDDREVKLLAGPRQDGALGSTLARLFETATKGHGALALLALAGLGAALLGLRHLETAARYPAGLGTRSALASDYQWFEQNVGNVTPLEIVITVPAERHRAEAENAEGDGQQYRMTLSEQVSLIAEVEQRVAGLSEMTGAVSAATLTAASGGIGDAERLRRDLSELELVQSEHRSGSDLKTGRQLYRISARMAAAAPGNPIDCQAALQRVREAVEPVLKSYEQRDWLIRDFHERGGELRSGTVAILFRGSDDATEPASGSAESLLGNLLKRSGTRRDGVAFVNVAPFERGGGAGAAILDRSVDQLRNVGAAVVASPVALEKSQILAALRSGGVNVVDLAVLPSIRESATKPLVELGGPRPIRAVTIGAPLVAAAVSQKLSEVPELAWQYALPCFVIAVMCVAWHPVVGLAMSAAIALPATLTLGALGWLGVSYDMGVVALAALALGMAIDGGVHYVAWFRRGIKAGLFRHEAARMAFARTAPATLDAALAIGIGCSVLALSQSAFLQQFGMAALGIELAVLFCCLAAIPAIMASPLAAMMGAHAAPTEAEEAIAAVRIVLPGEGDGEIIRPSRTDAATIGVPTPAHRSRTIPLKPEEAHEGGGPHAAIQAKLQRLRHASGE